MFEIKLRFRTKAEAKRVASEFAASCGRAVHSTEPKRTETLPGRTVAYEITVAFEDIELGQLCSSAVVQHSIARAGEASKQLHGPAWGSAVVPGTPFIIRGHKI